MVSYTTAIDTLNTAKNMVSKPQISFITLGANNSHVSSDLGIPVDIDINIKDFLSYKKHFIDVLIIVGGPKCTTIENTATSKLLKYLDTQEVVIGSFWNGAIALAHAGLLNNNTCAIHSSHYHYLKEKYPSITIAKKNFFSNNKYLTCADSVGALTMILYLIEQHYGKKIVKKIKMASGYSEIPNIILTTPKNLSARQHFPEKLIALMSLMENNIETPLHLDDLSQHINTSRRHIERLFKTHLKKTPARYYLEVRLNHARDLLLKKNDSIADIALACGFSSSSHFSNCYREQFGVSPKVSQFKGRLTQDFHHKNLPINS